MGRWEGWVGDSSMKCEKMGRQLVGAAGVAALLPSTKERLAVWQAHASRMSSTGWGMVATGRRTTCGIPAQHSRGLYVRLLQRRCEMTAS